MGIESLFTLQSGLTQPASVGKHAGADADGKTSSSLNFLDLILTKLNDINEKKDKSASIASDASTSETLNTTIQSLPLSTTRLNENTLSIDEFLSTHPEIEQSLKNFMASASGTANETAIISELPLTAPATPEKKPALLLLQLLQISPTDNTGNITQEISTLREKIQAMIEKGDNAIVTTNLTPEQITALQNAPDGEMPEELKNIGIIVIALLQPQQDNTNTSALEFSDDPALANALTLLTPPQQLKTQNGTTLPSLKAVLPEAEKEIASKLNALTPGAAEDGSEDLFAFEDFETALKTIETGTKTTNIDTTQNIKADVKNPQTAGPGFSALQGWPFAVNGGLFASATDTSSLYNDLGLSALSAQSLSTGAPSSLIVQSASATLPHPATQAIAVNIQKAANGGQNRTISLELDPPELGRIEVKLTFAKDKTMKAHVIAEKPETYMMLQRDSDVLQRALESSGLESDSGLSFELAEKGFDFNQNNERGGGHDTGGTGGADTKENEDIIHSTMTWQIDPESGHIRYDILA